MYRLATLTAVFFILAFSSAPVVAQVADLALVGGDAFITTWQTDNPGASDPDQITIPTFPGESYNYDVDWGDGNTDAGVTGDITHTYASAGTYTVEITGDFPRIYFWNDGELSDTEKILTVEQWGDIAWNSMAMAFRGASNLQVNASDAPDLSDVTSMSAMFANASSFNASIGHWDVSNVTDMFGLFFGLEASAFNQDIGGWDVSNVTNMQQMFQGASAFNQDISDWDVSGSTNMIGMFAYASAFNQDIGGWDVSNVTNMNGMFLQAVSFNQNIGGWDVSNVTDMSLMFGFLEKFNQDIGNWDVSNVTNMTFMFWNAFAFDQDLNGWDVSNVTAMPSMFSGARAFNGDIGNWDVSSVTDMALMFADATSFNQDIGSWDVSNVTSMRAMLAGTAFNQDIGGWDVSNVTNMSAMFASASAFNQDIGGWDVSSVENMSTMFFCLEDFGPCAFNQTLGGWDVSNVTNMDGMFAGASTFDQDIGDWNVSSVTDMTEMFSNSSLSIENYDNTLIGWADQAVHENVPLGAHGLVYCTGIDARQSLIDDHGWTITGDEIEDPDCGSIGTEDDPQEFHLSQATPNPASHVMALLLRVPETQNVTAQVYDTIGRLVATVHDGTLAAGEEVRLEIDVAALAAGAYVVHVEGETFSETRRVTVVR